MARAAHRPPSFPSPGRLPASRPSPPRSARAPFGPPLYKALPGSASYPATTPRQNRSHSRLARAARPPTRPAAPAPAPPTALRSSTSAASAASLPILPRPALRLYRCLFYAVILSRGPHSFRVLCGMSGATNRAQQKRGPEGPLSTFLKAHLLLCNGSCGSRRWRTRTRRARRQRYSILLHDLRDQPKMIVHRSHGIEHSRRQRGVNRHRRLHVEVVQLLPVRLEDKWDVLRVEVLAREAVQLVVLRLVVLVHLLRQQHAQRVGNCRKLLVDRLVVGDNLRREGLHLRPALLDGELSQLHVRDAILGRRAHKLLVHHLLAAQSGSAQRL